MSYLVEVEPMQAIERYGDDWWSYFDTYDCEDYEDAVAQVEHIKEEAKRYYGNECTVSYDEDSKTFLVEVDVIDYFSRYWRETASGHFVERDDDIY